MAELPLHWILQHTFASTGNYSVRLIVQTAGGCIDTLVQTLHLSLNHPTATFTPSNACVNAQLNFTDQSVSASAFSNWLWYFGDGSTTTVQSPAHNYAAAGTYNVSLVVQNVDGCTDSISHQVIISGLPSPNAGLDQTICNGDMLHWQELAEYHTPVSGNATTTSITVNPGSTQPYIYTATNIYGCQSSDTVTVFVRRGPRLNVSQNRSICRGDSTTISVNSNGGVTLFLSPGGATTSQITVHPNVTTNYFITATDTSGCRSWDTVVVSDTHHRLPMPVLIRIFVSVQVPLQCFRWIILQLESWRIYFTTNRSNSAVNILYSDCCWYEQLFRRRSCGWL